MKLTINLLRHPFRYPEWGEMLLAIVGLLQFAFGLANLHDLPTRAGYGLTVFFSTYAWVIAGLLLFIMHAVSLRFGGTSWGYTARLFAVGSSLAFWSHFVLSICMNSWLFGSVFPGTIVPSLGTPLLAGAVLYRLWRRY